MEELLKELIEVVKQSYNGTDYTFIFNVITSIIALISLVISLYVLFVQVKEKMLKKKVLGYIYSYYAPTYIANNLPTTEKVLKELKNVLFTKTDIFNTLVDLNKDGLIQAVATLDDDLNNVRWKPHMNFAK